MNPQRLIDDLTARIEGIRSDLESATDWDRVVRLQVHIEAFREVIRILQDYQKSDT